MQSIVKGGLLSVLIGLGLGSGASAQVGDLKVSHGVFHAAVCGKATVGTATCTARIVTDSAGNSIAHANPDVSGLGPADLRAAYNITKKGKAKTIIAIVDAYGYTNAESDLAVYRKNFGLPACTTDNGCFKKLNQNGQQGSYPAQNIGWAQESALDMDMASAMCPKCTIYLVEGNSNSYSDLATAVSTAGKLGAHVISNSYSGGESGTQSYEASFNQKNVAITASTGDGGYGVGFPATSPHVIAVGGTHLVKDGSQRGWTETAWNGAGSGCSTVYAKPTWQNDTGCGKRTIADVSAVADPATGVAVYGPNNSGVSTWLVFGGTSVSAPLIGGIYGVAGGKVNYASSLYAHTDQLYDVTSGSNGSCGGSYLCTAMPGYDGPTGLGTPNGTGAFK